MTSGAKHPSLDGRRLSAVHESDEGEVGPETTFDYRELDGDIWATYSGGAVRRGFLVGTRTGNDLAFRYCQLNVNGETSTGVCASRVTVTETGRLRLAETWEWESKPGSGTSAVEEISVR